MKVGITGQGGFIGKYLHNYLGLSKDIERIPFERDFFLDRSKLRSFVRQCDIIIHLAAVNRCPDPQLLYDTNISLTQKLVDAIETENVKPYIIFASSIQEKEDNLYGKSKQKSRILLEQWAEKNNASLTSMMIPNVFGPFGKPEHNSFIATFCYKLTHGEEPEIKADNTIELIYVGTLCDHFHKKIKESLLHNVPKIEKYNIGCDFKKKVSDVLSQLKAFKNLYYVQGTIPVIYDRNDINLFNTFRSYIDYQSHFPIKLKKSVDERGAFVETVKTGTGGQISFSTTKTGITRGNHFHTRKIERFIVIKGKALIQLRKTGTNEILNFELDGNEPAYVDMPIWYTHNIKNIGNDELYTQFWINEWYNPEDGDTYFESVE